MDEPLTIQVHCYSGYRGEQTPTAFSLGEDRVEIADVLDQWLAPDHRYFKVRAADGCIYILRHDPHADCWHLTYYARRSPGDNP